MSECPSLDIQDLLPEFAGERLDPDASGRVSAHLAACMACRRDVALLRQIRTVDLTVPAIDHARVVSAILAGRSSAGTGADVVAANADDAATDTTAHRFPRPALHVITGASVPPASPSSAVFRSRWRLATAWQMAAALTVAVSGVMATAMVQRGGLSVFTAGGGDTTLVAVAPVAGEQVTAVSYGDLADYSEGELETMLATLEGWDGSARTEPAAFEPVVVPVGGAR